MGTYECLLQKTGSGTPSSAHASAINERDVDGAFKPAAANIPLWRGSRKVTNLMTYSEDFDSAVWTPTYCSVTDNGDGTADLSPTAAVDSYLSHDARTNLVIGDDIICAIDVKGEGTAIGQTVVLRNYSGTGVNQSVTLTASYQRVALSRSLGATSSQVHLLLYLVSAGADIPTDGVVVVRRSQEEHPVGDASTTIPSEYVATTTAAVSKYYANDNGNSVASGIVTEVVGSALTDQPYCKSQVAATNIVTNSRDLSTGWSEVGTSAKAYNQVGMDGESNHASYIQDNDSGNYEYVYRVFTITSNTNPIVLRVCVLKETAGTYFPGVKWAFSTDGAGTRANFNYNKETGAIGVSFDGGLVTNAVEVVDMGDWWGIIIEADNISATSLFVALYGGIGTSTTANSATATGNVTIGNVEVFENKTVDDIRTLAPIWTAGTSVSTEAVTPTWDSANHNNTEGGHYVEIDWAGGDQDILLNDDVAIVYITSDVLYLDDGTNTISTAITTGEHQIGIAWETDTSEMDLCLDGTWYGSSDAYDGSFGTGDLSTEGTIRDLTGIVGDLATSKAAIDVIMAERAPD